MVLITTYGLMALGREMSTPPKLQQEYGTLFFTYGGGGIIMFQASLIDRNAASPVGLRDHYRTGGRAFLSVIQLLRQLL